MLKVVIIYSTLLPVKIKYEKISKSYSILLNSKLNFNKEIDLMKKKKARVIAFYLPQFHPIPENDEWWGKGFTEWTNVGRAKPLFRGHYQPRVPADLGYYDLRLPEVREAQAELAREAGIEGFCYWHYWFGNEKRLLERPFNEVLASGKPDFPFCLAWANHSWTNKSWNNQHIKKDNIYKDFEYICEQTYLEEDYSRHFYDVLPAFKDPRYIRVDDKPLFAVFSPLDIPDAQKFIAIWNKLAIENGLKGIYFVGRAGNFKLYDKSFDSKRKYSLSEGISAEKHYQTVLDLGFDAVNSTGITRAQVKSESFLLYYLKRFLKIKLGMNFAHKHQYSRIIRNIFVKEDTWENVFPSIIPNFDRSPRSGKNERSIIWHNSTPELFKKHLENAMDLIKNKEDEHKILFLMSWNEWAEGNYVEPDLKFGHGYLDVIRDILKNDK